MVILVFIPLIIALVWAMHGRKGLYMSTLACCGGIVIGMILFALAVQATTGSDILSYYRTMSGEYLEQNELLTLYGYSVLTGNPDISSVTFAEALPVMKSYMAEQITYLVPSIAAGVAAIGGLIIYLIVRAIAKAFGADVVKIPHFTMFFLPRHFGRYSVLCYIIVYIGMRMGWNGFTMAFYIVSALLGCIYFVQGLCFLDYVMKLKINSVVLRIVILFIISLMFIYFFVFLGLFEQVFKIRKRIEAGRSGII